MNIHHMLSIVASRRRNSQRFDKVTAKSVVFDVASNHQGSDKVGVRSIEFLVDGKPLQLFRETDYTAIATTSYHGGADYGPEYAFQSDSDKMGDAVAGVTWLSDDGCFANQRLVVVFSESRTFDEIVINNYHSRGSLTGLGARDVAIVCSPHAVTDATFGAAIRNGRELGKAVWPRHIDSDVADDQTVWKYATL